jgi:hypothetical protein
VTAGLGQSWTSALELEKKLAPNERLMAVNDNVNNGQPGGESYCGQRGSLSRLLASRRSTVSNPSENEL